MCVCLRLIDAEIACSAPEEDEAAEAGEEEQGEMGKNCNWKAEPKVSFMFGFSHAMMIIFHTHLDTEHTRHTHL